MAIVLLVVALLCAGATVLIVTGQWDVSMAESTAQLRVQQATARRVAAVALEAAQVRWAAPTAPADQDPTTPESLVFDWQGVPRTPSSPADHASPTALEDLPQIPPGLAPAAPPPAPPTELTAPGAVN